MKLFFAMLGTETNTFSALPTGMNIWRNTTLRYRERDEPTIHRNQRAYQPLFARMDARGWSLHSGLLAFASPAGVTPRNVYERLRDELLANLADAGPVDGVLLFLHGAMVADGYEDCEGDLLQRVRAHIGPQVPLGAELDLHCHISEQMVENADLLIGYRDYPHVDTYDRLGDLFELIADTAEGKIQPHIATYPCNMIGMFRTTNEPMASLVESMRALGNDPAQPDVLDVWLAHGFPYGDVPDLGSHVIVTTNNKPELGTQIGQRISEEFYAMRKQVQSYPLTIEAAIDEGLACFQRSPHMPVTIADTGDNTGGGAPGDSTFFLQALLNRGQGNCAIGPLYDPMSVSICQDGGVGARLRLRVGGKLGPESGDPVDVECEVLGLADRVVQTLNGGPSNFGPSVGIRVLIDPAVPATPDNGIDITLTSRRIQAGSREMFDHLNIEAREKQLLIVKSTQHFHAGFAPLSSTVLYAGDKGALQGDFLTIPYRKADVSKLWPFSETS